MKILAFDTSTKYLSIACFEDKNCVVQFHKDIGIQHSNLLIPTIESLLKQIKWDIKQINLLCVGIGPGSFTGLRIGIAVAKALTFIVKNNIVTVPTMDAMVYNYTLKDSFIAPLLDARKGKVYVCVYKKNKQNIIRITDYLLIEIEQFLKTLDKEVFFFGDAITKYKTALDNCKFAKYDETFSFYPKAKYIALKGLEKSKNYLDDYKKIVPLYLHSKECNIL